MKISSPRPVVRRFMLYSELSANDLEIFKQSYVRRISSTDDIAAMVLGKPIVVIASTPTCRSSSSFRQKR
jgi:hypothetical protein